MSGIYAYSDIITNDEVLSSEAGKVEEAYEGTMLKCISKMINPDAGDVDVGNCDHFGGGESGNNDEPVEMVCNLVYNFNLQPYGGSKKVVVSAIKEGIKKVVEKMKNNGASEERLKEWGPGGQVEKFVKDIVKEFDECTFYMSSSYDNGDEGMMIVSKWDNDEDTGETFYYFKDALRSQKC